MGVAKFMLSEIEKLWPNSYAKIKPENIASQKLFQSAGYEVFYLIYKKSDSQLKR